MPVYTYQCAECEVISDIRHSMGEAKSDCPDCGSTDSLVRIPSTFSVSGSKAGIEKATAKQRVDTFISDAKKELEQHKEDSRVDYEP